MSREAEYNVSMSKKRIQHRKDTSHSDYPHGTFAGGRSGCKCDLCVISYRDYYKTLMRSKRDQNPSYRELDKIAKRKLRQTSEGKAYNKANAAKRKAILKNIDISANKELIQEIYRHCPEGYVVDHIIPLSKGGTHHESNLQYLPKLTNLIKGAKLDFNYSNEVISWQSIVSEPSTTSRKT